MRKLYVYDHCPFCIKARMIFGLKNIPVELVVLQNDDEATPIGMIGQKMLPILEENGHYMGESLDIIAHIDQEGAPLLTVPARPEISDWISRSSSLLYRQFLPRAAAAPFPEFSTTSGRAYFIRKKEASTGPFCEVFNEGTEALLPLNALLEDLSLLLPEPSALQGPLSYDDIHLFAHLHSFSIIKGLTYPAAVESYRQTLSKRSGIPLLDAIAV
ncbi:glutaredoxin 2 [Acetobacter ascendens]|uniref:Glutaredoxin, GrxB family n=1 Tax=Acetobacter ascendens TaxID=481146 RepID=A0A1D8QVC5_9PROT|nr:glutaredoxin 2 [Acetobacter ascendens]AOW46287.1 glutaredoxin, GrxB family [Acetobacter ascendens]AOW49703.1 glutaredoxin, GrxB family [Acetobacter ascendens]